MTTEQKRKKLQMLAICTGIREAQKRLGLHLGQQASFRHLKIASWMQLAVLQIETNDPVIIRRY